MKTKIISLCIVAALMLCMSVNVFAADALTSVGSVASTTDDKTLDESTMNQTITVGSTLYLPEINVKVSAPQSVIVNPYKMDYSGSGDISSLISAPTTIESTSTIKMDVSAVPKAVKVAGSKVEFSQSPGVENDSTLTKPTVYIAMEMANFASTSDVTNWTNATNESPVVVSESNTEAASITLLASTDGTTATVGGYHFKGESGGPSWGNGDVIKIDVIFSINPVIA